MGRGVDAKDQYCLNCNFKAKYATEQPSNMINHIRNHHPELIPYVDMLEYAKPFHDAKIRSQLKNQNNYRLSFRQKVSKKKTQV